MTAHQDLKAKGIAQALLGALTRRLGCGLLNVLAPGGEESRCQYDGERALLQESRSVDTTNWTFSSVLAQGTLHSAELRHTKNNPDSRDQAYLGFHHQPLCIQVQRE
ncbi:hypothetical protein CISG_00049 [Coccidioides immitis RMSCC 3703]|uniref:Uncharacterized protein n=1 Tax=Coccidioides immitis RMSCC 3703 TaxID=454286 RepID=A0A0J8QHB5_COCIT|nr:hypothetical protein CISG_00049 [Coccidioides immitis RMSCC 3703]